MQTFHDVPAREGAAPPPKQAGFGDLMRRIAEGKNVKVAALADAIGISKGGLYLAIRRGEVEAVNVGTAVFVPAREARRLLGLDAKQAA